MYFTINTFVMVGSWHLAAKQRDSRDQQRPLHLILAAHFSVFNQLQYLISSRKALNTYVSWTGYLDLSSCPIFVYIFWFVQKINNIYIQMKNIQNQKFLCGDDSKKCHDKSDPTARTIVKTRKKGSSYYLREYYSGCDVVQLLDVLVKASAFGG